MLDLTNFFKLLEDRGVAADISKSKWILDISGIYVQIHDQGYFDSKSIDLIKQQYSNMKHWRVLVLDE